MAGMGKGRILSVISFGVDSWGTADEIAASTLETTLLTTVKAVDSVPLCEPETGGGGTDLGAR